MKRFSMWTAAGCVAAVLCVWVGGCARAAAKPTLKILCGSSMADPMQEAGKLFGERRGVKVEYDFGGSETLLPRVLEGAKADIFICHDPFEDGVQKGGHLAGSVVVGELRPVLVVPAGNPKGIRTVDDLGKEGVKIALGTPEFNTCGAKFVAMIESRGLKDRVMKQVTYQARSHTDLANAVVVGAVDVAVVWNFIGPLHAGKLDVIEMDAKFEPIRVTVLGLTQSEAPAQRDAFLEFCRTPEVLEIFRKHGYTSAGGV